MIFLLVNLPDAAAQVATSACARLASAFRPATRRAHERMFRIFLTFLVAAGLPSCQVNHSCLLAFMEYLYQNQFSPANIQNYMAGIRAQFILHNLDTTPFQHQQIQYVYKSQKINRPLQPRSHTYIDLVISSCTYSNLFPDPLVYKSLLLVAYFSFLRLSNLLPHTVGSFDPTRQLATGDILFSNQGATLLIKWSKTPSMVKRFTTLPCSLLVYTFVKSIRHQ